MISRDGDWASLQAGPQDAEPAVPDEADNQQDRGPGDGTTESVRLYIIAEEIFWAATWCAPLTLVGVGLVSIVPLWHWLGWPGAVTGAAITALAAGLVFWMTCSGPCSVEVSHTRLRLMDRRGRQLQRFERADVKAVELCAEDLWVNEDLFWHRHRIAVHNVAPRRVPRLRTALRRYGWLEPAVDRPSA